MERRNERRERNSRLTEAIRVRYDNILGPKLREELLHEFKRRIRLDRQWSLEHNTRQNH